MRWSHSHRYPTVKISLFPVNNHRAVFLRAHCTDGCTVQTGALYRHAIYIDCIIYDTKCGKGLKHFFAGDSFYSTPGSERVKYRIFFQSRPRIIYTTWGTAFFKIYLYSSFEISFFLKYVLSVVFMISSTCSCRCM